MLLALLALGASTVLLHPSSSAAQTEGSAVPAATEGPSAPAPTEPPADPVAPADPVPPPNPPVEEAEEPLPEPVPSAPEWDRSAGYEVPGSAADPESPAPGDDDAEEPAPEPEEPAAPAPTTGAVNQSTVLQAILQVQVGCRTHCHGTGQSQSAAQGSNTTQNATAIAPEGSSGGAAAANQSSTMQFVWQLQLGCVAFCWDTSMSQSASQDAQTTQTATAAGDLSALALNIAQTLQYVWQMQEGCATECYGVSETQSISQQQSTSQSATASGPDYAGWRPDGTGGLPSWLTAFALNIGATIQTIFQYQEASCLSHCGAEALLQEAVQDAQTNQTAAAGDVPEPVSEPPAAPPSGTPAQPPASDGGSILAHTAQALLGPASPERQRPRRRASGPDNARRSSEPAAPRGGSSSPPGTLGGGSDAQAPASSSVGHAATAAATAPAAPKPNADRERAESPSSGIDGAPASPQVALETIPSSGSTDDGSGFPWLPASLLLIAALAATMGLRTRPGPLGA